MRVDLPSSSQVDSSVFEALPEDICQKREAEYELRSAPLKLEHETERPRRAASVNPPHTTNDRLRDHGTSASRGGRSAPSRSRSSLSQPPIAAVPAGVRVKPDELVEPETDADVFAALPANIQRAARGSGPRNSPCD